jgi:hypothetical protein
MLTQSIGNGSVDSMRVEPTDELIFLLVTILIPNGNADIAHGVHSILCRYKLIDVERPEIRRLSD